MAIVTRNDWIPRYRDAGYDTVVIDLLNEYGSGGLDLFAFILRMDQRGDLEPLTDLSGSLRGQQLLADFYINGVVPNILVDGQPLTAGGVQRLAAPGGIGQDGSAIFFSTPSSGTYVVNWYRNGEIIVSQSTDLAVDRSMAKATLGVVADDVVQIALVNDDDVVSWWGRIVVS